MSRLIEPRGSRMLIRIIANPENLQKTDGGVMLPGAVDDLKTAEVVAVGPKADLAVGTLILVQEALIVRVYQGGVELRMMDCSDAMAIVTDVPDPAPAILPVGGAV